jgi:hypothetical protein
LNTVAAPLATFMNDKNANADYTQPQKNISRQSPQPQPTHGEELTAVSTAASGSPFDVQYVKYFGACPRSANPYKIRDEQNRKLFPAENALVNTQALMMCGRTER